MAIGVTVGINYRRARSPRQPEQAAVARRSHQEAVQNALGFIPASISTAEYPGIQGIFIDSLISDDSPAALGNIRAGDVLLELNERSVRNLAELAAALDPIQPGSDAPVKIYRDGETIASRIRVADQAYPPLQPKIPPKEQGFLGVSESSRRCCIPGTKKWGVEIVKVIDNSPADLMGLQSGDVITEFQGQAVRTPGELNRRIREVRPRSKAQLKFYRGNTEQTIELVLGHR
jgi:S1-C subfamily serine protease